MMTKHVRLKQPSCFLCFVTGDADCICKSVWKEVVLMVGCRTHRVAVGNCDVTIFGPTCTSSVLMYLNVKTLKYASNF